MKQLFASLLLLTSLSASANELCYIQGVGTAFYVNGEIAHQEKIAALNYKKRVEKWEDCYQFAIDKSKEYKTSIDGTVSNLFRSANATIHISFNWSYNDGMIDLMNTSGKITQYTDQYEQTPYDGDMRYRADGRSFK